MPQARSDNGAFDPPREEPWYGALEFRTLAETMPALLFVTNRHGHAIYTNSGFQRYSGLPHEEIAGPGYLDVLHHDDRLRAERLWSEIVSSTEPYEIEHRMRRHDGSYRWHQVRGAPVIDANGKTARWINVCTDIQELRSAVAAAADAQEMIAVLGRSTDAIVFAKDADGRFVFANDATLQAMEAKSNTVIGASLAERAGVASEVVSIDANDARVLANREMIIVEERWTTKAGVERVYRSTKGPWQRADGSVGIIGITTDITRERQLALQLKEQQHAYRNLADNLPFILWITDAEGRIIVRNNLWEAQTGLPDTQSQPLSFIDLIDPQYLQEFVDCWQSCIAHADILDANLRLRDAMLGRSILHRLVAVPVRDLNGAVNGWVGSAVPVTARD
jgi:PAS domain S-box-containing protein